MRCAIKTCTYNTIVADAPSIKLTYLRKSYRLFEFGSINCVRHSPGT